MAQEFPAKTKMKTATARRQRVQTTALALALLAPFGLYWALQNNLVWLALLFFAVITFSMALVVARG